MRNKPKSIVTGAVIAASAFCAVQVKAQSQNWRFGVGVVEYMLVRAQGDENKQLLSLGPKETHESMLFISSLYQVMSDATGNVLITVDALCRNGPDLTAFVNVIFFS